jgi:hypothetical protein
VDTIGTRTQIVRVYVCLRRNEGSRHSRGTYMGSRKFGDVGTITGGPKPQSTTASLIYGIDPAPRASQGLPFNAFLTKTKASLHTQVHFFPSRTITLPAELAKVYLSQR